MLAGQAVQGAVALTDSGIRRRGDTNRRQLQAQEYAGKLQEILARAAVSEPEEQVSRAIYNPPLIALQFASNCVAIHL